MALKDVLAVVEERGLYLKLDEQGVPLIGGPRKEKTPALFEVLKLYRSEIIAMLKAEKPPTPPAKKVSEVGVGNERVVALRGDRDSEVEKVLASCRDHIWSLSTIRNHAKFHKGKTLAIEKWEVNRVTGIAGWRRFFWRHEDRESGTVQEAHEDAPREP
jgi:hypothetical protein